MFPKLARAHKLQTVDSFQREDFLVTGDEHLSATLQRGRNQNYVGSVFQGDLKTARSTSAHNPRVAAALPSTLVSRNTLMRPGRRHPRP